MPVACHLLGAYRPGLRMVSRDPQASPARALSLLPQYHRGRNGRTETFSDLPRVTRLEGGRAALNPARETPGPQTLVSVCPFFLLPTQTLEIRRTCSDLKKKNGVIKMTLGVIEGYDCAFSQACTTTRSRTLEPDTSPASWMSAKASRT